MIVTTAADGTDVRAFDDGRGPVVVIVHAGRDDGTSWGPVAALLSARFRVVRVQRRRYRQDLAPSGPRAIADEVAEVAAITRLTGEPVVLVGHSSGAIVALEALVASPSSFAGAVLYEPPAVIGPPLGGEALVRARAALDAGRQAESLAIFLRDVVRIPAFAARVVKLKVTLRRRELVHVRPQIEDCEAVEQLGNRLDAYGRIRVPVVLFGGERSPAHFGERLDALAKAIPNSERVAIPGQGHFAHSGAPKKVAGLIAALADKILR